MRDNILHMLHALAQKIYDKKGSNIIAIDVRDVTSMTEYFLIAEGNVERHVQSLCREVVSLMDEEKYEIYHIEGDQTGDWIAIDGGQMMIHLLTPELREKYSLEELWHEGKIVDLDLKLDRDKNNER